MLTKGYKIRQYVNGRNKAGEEYTNYSLTVPNSIAEALPEGMTFIPQMTEQGLLYVPASQIDQVMELPAWARSEPEENGKPKTKQRAKAAKTEPNNGNDDQS